MPENDPGTTSTGPEREHRRSGRLALVIPLIVKWSNDKNVVVREEAEAVEVSMHGAVLRMSERPPVGVEVELTNCASDEVARARVVDIRRWKPNIVAVELLVPSDSFWGITFKIKRVASELRRLDQEIKSGAIDARVLQEFREAVDYVRKTAWAVHEWQERQFKHKDTSTVISLLTTERIRRATQLTGAIAADVDVHQLKPDNPAILELLRAMEHLHQKLARSPSE